MRNTTSNSADIVLRNNTSRSMVMAGFLSDDPTAGPITVDGTMSDFERTDSVAMSLTLTQDDFANVTPNRIDDGWQFLDPEGNETAFSIKSYSLVQAIGDVDQIHSGILVDDQGNESDFVVITDPAAGPIIVVVVLVVAIVALVNVQQQRQTCETVLSADIAACNARGGLPSVKMHFSGGPKFDLENKKFSVAPQLECESECRPGPGQ